MIFWKSRKLGARILEISELFLGGFDCHPSDDRPCTTTHLKGHGLSTGGGGDHIHIYIYIFILCLFLYLALRTTLTYYATVYEHIRRGVLPTHVPPEVNRSHAAPLDERISDSFLLFNPRKKRPCETGQKCSGTFLLNSPRKKRP